MPIHMPYTTEKAAAFQVVEDYMNADRPRACEMLFDLVDGKRVTDVPPIASSTLNVSPPPYNDPDYRKQYVREEWWGEKKLPNGQWQPPPAFNKQTHPTTGFWEYWYGEPEPVFTETLVLGMCVALGVRRPDRNISDSRKQEWREELNNGTQHWPTSIFWKCPAPWFEGWIEFQRWGRGRRAGHVTIIMSTPAHGVKLYNAPQRPMGRGRNRHPWAYQEDPREPAGNNGLWVVS